MTIPANVRRDSYTGTGSVATYDYTFRITAAADLLVTTADTDGVETTLTYPADYSVAGVGNADGGTITLTAGNLASGYAIVIRDDPEQKQETDLRNQVSFFAEVHEDAFDYVTRLLMAQQDVLSRTLVLGETASGVDTTVPPLEAGLVLSVNAGADGFFWGSVPSAPVSAFMATVLDDADALAARTTLGAPEGGRGAGTPTPVEGLTVSNVAVGLNALIANVDGYENTAVGVHALKSNTTGTENNAFGTKALELCTTGAENVAMGVRALGKLTDGTDNTAIGHAAMNDCTGGDDNTAVGQTALYRLTTGNRNTAVGRQALEHVLTGSDNTAVGHSALGNCTGSTNTAIGRVAGSGMTSGSGNTLAGYSAASSLQTGNFNVIAGYQAMNVATAASNCVYVGYQAGYVSTGNNNTGVGNQSMLANTDGTDNAALGILSLSANTSGDGNVAVGNLALSSNTTGDHNVAVGMSAFTSGTNYSNSSCLGYNSQVTGSNQVQLGDSATTTYAYGAVQNRSDRRDKADIRDTVLGLDFILALRPVDFRWAYREDGGQKRTRYHHGLIAQEVEALGAEFGGLQHHAVAGGQDVYTIGYDELTAPLIKAVQELAARVAALEAGR